MAQKFGAGGWRTNTGRRVFAQPDTPPWAPAQVALHQDDSADEMGSRPPGQNDPDHVVGQVPDELLDRSTFYTLERAPGDRRSIEPEDRHTATKLAGSESDASAVVPVGQLPRYSTRLHSIDRGQVEDRTRIYGPNRQGEQVDNVELRMPFDGSPVSDLAAVRGRNSLPANNPDGIARLGMRRFRWTERKMFSAWLRHDEHVVTIRTAAAATSSPGGTNRNAPPSSSTAVVKANMNMSGILRRTPPPWDEPVLSDQPAPVAPAFQAWGF